MFMDSRPLKNVSVVILSLFQCILRIKPYSVWNHENCHITVQLFCKYPMCLGFSLFTGEAEITWTKLSPTLCTGRLQSKPRERNDNSIFGADSQQWFSLLFPHPPYMLNHTPQHQDKTTALVITWFNSEAFHGVHYPFV